MFGNRYFAKRYFGDRYFGGTASGGTPPVVVVPTSGGGGGGIRSTYIGQRAPKKKNYLPPNFKRKEPPPAPTPELIKAVEREIVAEVAPEAPQKPEVAAYVRQEVVRAYRPQIDYAALQDALEQISAAAAELDASLRRQAVEEAARVKAARVAAEVAEAARIEAARIEAELEDEDEFMMMAA